MISPYSLVGIRQNDFPKLIGKMLPEEIIEAIASFYGLTIDEIKARCRERKIVQARFVAAYFLREYTNLTLKEIACLFGKGMTDHTSVMHAVKSVNDQLSLKGDNYTKKEIEALKNSFSLTVQTIQKIN